MQLARGLPPRLGGHLQCRDGHSNKESCHSHRFLDRAQNGGPAKGLLCYGGSMLPEYCLQIERQVPHLPGHQRLLLG